MYRLYIYIYIVYTAVGCLYVRRPHQRTRTVWLRETNFLSEVRLTARMSEVCSVEIFRERIYNPCEVYMYWIFELHFW